MVSISEERLRHLFNENVMYSIRLSLSFVKKVNRRKSIRQ